MGKYDSYYRRYGSGYPTAWSNWMYPPKGVSSLQYVREALNGYFGAKRPEFRSNWFMWTLVPVFGYFCYRLRHLESYPYNHNITSDKHSWIYGPPDPKEVEKRRVHNLLEAPEK